MLHPSRDKAIVILAAELKRTKRQAVQGKVDANECLLCEQKPWKRGLCGRCYGRFRTQLLKIQDPVERAEFEAEHIREGNVLESQQGRREDPNVPNPFREKAS